MGDESLSLCCCSCSVFSLSVTSVRPVALVNVGVGVGGRYDSINNRLHHSQNELWTHGRTVDRRMDGRTGVSHG